MQFLYRPSLPALHTTHMPNLPSWAPHHWLTWIAVGWALTSVLQNLRHARAYPGKRTLSEGDSAGCSNLLLLLFTSAGLPFPILAFFFDHWPWPLAALITLMVAASVSTPKK